MSKEPDPLSVDFAAIRTLRLVFDFGSFSKTADFLDMNQSSVSYTIDRLRRVFRDPLFVRQGMGIAPTDRCIEIVGRARQILDEFEALATPPQFDPAQAAVNVAISCNDYGRLAMLPPAIEEIRRRAPNLFIEVTAAGSQGVTRLKRGEADLVIGPKPIDGDEIYFKRLLIDHYVCVMDKANPLSRIELGVDEYVNANHAVVTYGDKWRSPYLLELDERSLKLNQKLAVPSPSDLASVLPRTDLISTVPSSVSRHLGDSIIAADCPIHATIELGLIWSSRTHHSEVHKWIRQLLVDTCAKIPA